MKVFWSRCAGGKNFGDVLGPLILDAFYEGPNKGAEWAPIEEADIVTIGSVVSKIPDGWEGIVLGTGTQLSKHSVDLSMAQVLAVRGALTRDRCGLPKDTLLGDLGILAGLLAPPLSERENKGPAIAPHYADEDMAARYPDHRVISMTAPPLEVIAEIAASSVVVTSSLHALIAADALGIPHKLEPSSKVIGGLWKFQDYGSALGEEIRPGELRLSDPQRMAEKIEELRGALGRLSWLL